MRLYRSKSGNIVKMDKTGVAYFMPRGKFLRFISPKKTSWIKKTFPRWRGPLPSHWEKGYKWQLLHSFISEGDITETCHLFFRPRERQLPLFGALILPEGVEIGPRIIGVEKPFNKGQHKGHIVLDRVSQFTSDIPRTMAGDFIRIKKRVKKEIIPLTRKERWSLESHVMRETGFTSQEIWG